MSIDSVGDLVTYLRDSHHPHLRAHVVIMDQDQSAFGKDVREMAREEFLAEGAGKKGGKAYADASMELSIVHFFWSWRNFISV